MHKISAEVPDLAREYIHQRYWDRGRRLVRAIRGYQAAKARGGLLGAVLAKFWGLQFQIWAILTQSQIPPNTAIEGGLFLPHATGIIVHPKTHIGPNCTLFQQVTLGSGQVGGGLPHLVGDVMVGAGAKILGPVRIGAHARIGANAVVLQDVPDGASAVGIPARIIPAKTTPPEA